MRRQHIQAICAISFAVAADVFFFDRSVSQSVDDVIKVIFVLWCIDVVASYFK